MIAENGRDKGDSTVEVPVQKAKTAIRVPGKGAYGVLSHVPSCGAKYALALELTDPGFDASVLSEFRTRLIHGAADHLLLEPLLRRLEAPG